MAVRVLIVDDSPFVREILREALSRYPDIEIVGEASDGKRAETMVMELRPDVVTMDVVMPMVGGMDAIRMIMESCPTPIVVVSDEQGGHEKQWMAAIEAGALDTFAKPRSGFDQEAADKLVALLRIAARRGVKRRPRRTAPPPLSPQIAVRRRSRSFDFVGIVSSTGGPQTLQRFLIELPHNHPPPIAIVQHTSPGHTGSLTSWLDNASDLAVKVARDGMIVASGTVVVAPDDLHLEIRPGGVCRLHNQPKIGGHRPSGTLLLRSLAYSFGPAALGIVLTGMGDDGAAGARAIEERGGAVLVESPESAVIEGMPKAAIHATRAPQIATAREIAHLIPNVQERSGRP